METGFSLHINNFRIRLLGGNSLCLVRILYTLVSNHDRNNGWTLLASDDALHALVSDWNPVVLLVHWCCSSIHCRSYDNPWFIHIKAIWHLKGHHRLDWVWSLQHALVCFRLPNDCSTPFLDVLDLQRKHNFEVFSIYQISWRDGSAMVDARGFVFYKLIQLFT